MAGLKDSIAKWALSKVRADGFINQITGLGSALDKRMGATYCADRLLSMPELESLFMSNDLANTIVCKLVDDALREGFDVKRRQTPDAPEQEDATKPKRDPFKSLLRKDSEDAEDYEREREMAERILARCRELGVREHVYNAAIWGRLFGGGAVILGVAGGGTPATELKDDKVKRVEFLVDVDRQDLLPQTWFTNGEVETYMWTPVLPGNSPLSSSPITVHASRVVLFPGAKTTNRARARNQGWDHSVIQRIYSVLLGVDGMWASLENMFSDMSQAVFKIQGFIASLAENPDGDTITTRMQLMNMIRSAARAIVLDAGDETGAGAESFEVVERGAMTGVDGILDKAFIRLACAARMPVTVLMGQSPAGMDATGDSDLEIWGNEVQCERRHKIEPRLERIVQLIARELGDEDPTLWTIEWPNLRPPTTREEAELEKLRVDTVAVLIDKMVALPEEVALSLDDIAPTLGLELDRDAREAALEGALEQMTNPPDPMAAPGAVDPETGEPVAAPAVPGQPPGQPPKPGAPVAEKKPAEEAIDT